MCRDRGYRCGQELRARTNFAEFTDGEARNVLQDVDVDHHAHCDGTPEKKVWVTREEGAVKGHRKVVWGP